MKMVTTYEYEFSHGALPRGYGLWWFEFISPDGVTVHSVTAKYSEAKREALSGRAKKEEQRD